MAAPIFIISGVPGAGKTTVSHALADQFPAVLLVEGDELRERVVRGRADPLDGWSSAHQLQFDLSYRIEALMAAQYADVGFVVIIDDIVREDDLRRQHLPILGDRRLRRVLLRPSLARAVERNRARTNKSFDTKRLDPHVHRLHGAMNSDLDGWLVIDSSALSVDETVARILNGFDPLGRPRVPGAQVRKY